MSVGCNAIAARAAPTQAPMPSTSCTNPRNSATIADKASTASTTPSTQFIAAAV